MIEFRRTMEMSITITDPRYTEKEIAEGLSDGSMNMGDADGDDAGKIFNSAWDEIATIDDLHVSDVMTPDVQFSVI